MTNLAHMPQIGPGYHDPLGVTTDHHGGANVALWAAGADAVEFCVFDEELNETRYPLTERTFAVYHGYFSDLPPGTRYGFRVSGTWDPSTGKRWNPKKLLTDPYAKALCGELIKDPSIFDYVLGDEASPSTLDSVGSVPFSVVVEDHTDWSGDTHPRTAWSDTIIYETHVRGLTMQHPDVPEALRGTYAGLAHPSIINYFTDLGVTAIELLPVHHFVDETHLLDVGLTNYWGYNSIGYFAPHARYSSSGERGHQVHEFKSMVKALHAAGLEVILDVVYNHTAEGNQLGPTLSFRGIDNGDYYRLAEDPQYYMDYTGCGNTLNVSNPHVLQLVMDSLRYWVTHMHVDGFRFDLASALARSFHDVDMLGSFMTTIAQDPILRNVKLIAEPWDVGPGGYQVGEFPPLWTEWNGKYRDNLREFWKGTAGIGELGWRLTGSADLYASEGRRPSASINFITAHDGFTMRDLNSYNNKHNEANLEDNRDGTNDNHSYNYGVEGETNDQAILDTRHRQIRNMLASLFLSTGVPMMLGGDELGRTQQGNNNGYCQDNEISWYDWALEPWQVELHAFTKRLIGIRKSHKAFRQKYFFAGRPVHEGGPKDLAWIGADGKELDESEWNSPDSRTFAMFINGHIKDPWQEQHDGSFFVMFNAAVDSVPFTLPGAPYGHTYEQFFDTNAIHQDAPVIYEAGDTVDLAGRSTILLRVY